MAVKHKDSLDYLPECRKRIGKDHHMKIYRCIRNRVDDFDSLNDFLHGIFPEKLRYRKRRIFFEIDFGCRVPDCIVCFTGPETRSDSVQSTVCYVLEFKTTLYPASWKSVSENNTHHLQYVQGLKQLRDSVRVFGRFAVPEGEFWEVIPTIVFFRQRRIIRASISRVFKGTEHRLCGYSVLNFLLGQQDVSVKNVLSITGGRVRTARRKRAAVPDGDALSHKRRRGSRSTSVQGRGLRGQGASSTSGRGDADLGRKRGGGMRKTTRQGRRGGSSVAGGSRGRRSDRRRSAA
ncbi:B76 [miniopterid betaherpesvirus 1]|uniref:B76 n=1 Tax=miniopterid betaherpesvirus 1 TaxID=3070189 RepID=I3VQ70_9BETA|nr:B76 [miniopterid betaherpesvirus 1]AFK83914.1 B76 [miniopterid betaherpesvirus 1]